MAETSKTSARSLVSVTADATSPATQNTGYVGTPVSGFSKFKSITFVATLLGGVGGNTDVLVETSNDGADWYEYIHFAQKAAGSAATTHLYTPDSNAGAIVTTGKNNLANVLGTTMVLTVATAAGGRWMDRLRIRYVTGASVSAGAAQSVVVMCTEDA